MENKNAIQLFEDQPIRAAWDEEKEEWFFSVVDVCQVLSGTDNPRRYWSALKRKLKAEGSELYEKIVQLKMKASDGKKRMTDVADTEQLLRIIQSIPSPKAEPILWSSLIRPLYVRIAQKQPETACSCCSLPQNRSDGCPPQCLSHTDDSASQGKIKSFKDN